LCPIEAGWAKTHWNGLALRHPPSWEVTRLERDQVQWSDGARAALEVRWARLKGRYDAERVFKRFGRRARRKGLPRPEPWPVPRSWQAGLSRFRVSGFSWRRSLAEGRGLLIYCPRCRRQSLMQIHPLLAGQSDLLPPLLASFNDHPHGGELPLSLFGIRARLPGGARLLQFRFETGRYRLDWRLGRLHIGLHRWAPAGAVLQRQTLAGFAAGQFQMAPAGLKTIRQNSFPAVEGKASSGYPLPATLRNMLSQRRVRVWHVPHHNSLLGVVLRGAGGERGALFNRLCDAYETE
jgi:hypothetical protein